MYVYPLLVKFDDGGSSEISFTSPVGRAQYFWALIMNQPEGLASAEVLPARDEAGNDCYENYHETVVLALLEHAPAQLVEDAVNDNEEQGSQ